MGTLACDGLRNQAKVSAWRRSPASPGTSPHAANTPSGPLPVCLWWVHCARACTSWRRGEILGGTAAPGISGFTAVERPLGTDVGGRALPSR